LEGDIASIGIFLQNEHHMMCSSTLDLGGDSQLAMLPCQLYNENLYKVAILSNTSLLE